MLPTGGLGSVLFLVSESFSSSPVIRSISRGSCAGLILLKAAFMVMAGRLRTVDWPKAR